MGDNTRRFITATSIAVVSFAIFISYTVTFWHRGDEGIGMQSLNKIKAQLRLPETDALMRDLIKVMYGTRAGDTKFVFLVDQTKLLRAEILICNLMGKGSKKLLEANVFFFALDKPSYETLKDLWIAERIVYFPYDKVIPKLRQMEPNGDWVIRAILTERLTRWYGDVFAVFPVETSWFKEPNSLGFYLKRRKDTWDLVTNTVGYWGPLASKPLYSMYFVNPSPKMRLFMAKLVKVMMETGKRDRVIIAELCRAKFEGMQCNWTNAAQNIKPSFFVTTPEYRRNHLGMNLDYTVWHHYMPRQKEFEFERLKQYDLYYLQDGQEGRFCNVTKSKKRKPVTNLWMHPVDFRLWYFYLVHSFLQYILPVSML